MPPHKAEPVARRPETGKVGEEKGEGEERDQAWERVCPSKIPR